MSDKCVLYVEGLNDEHVCYSLFEHYAVPQVFKVTAKKGIGDILKTLRSQLKFRDDAQLERIGVMLDADDDLAARWRELRGILLRGGYQDVPEAPLPHGLVLEQEDQPVIGVWIMPDNTVPGQLEHFIKFLVPDGDILWVKAEEILQQLPERRFPEPAFIKAQVHTWLAWQEEPGTPMSLSITKKYLDANAPQAGQFISWIRRLFVMDDS